MPQTAALATTEELIAYLGSQASSADADVLQTLLDAAEKLLEGRTGRLFSAGRTVTEEPHDGLGTSTIYSDREIASLTAVLIEQDPASPTYTLDHTNKNVIAHRGRRIVRTDGGVFTDGVMNVWLSYVSADELYADAKQCVMELAGAAFLTRDKQGLASEKIGKYGYTSAGASMDVAIERLAAESMTFQQVVAHYTIPAIG